MKKKVSAVVPVRKKAAAKKAASASGKPGEVEAWMSKLKHALKPEAERLRELLKKSHPSIRERIKWNAPSYHCGVDLVTFNFGLKDRIRLVFHHPEIVNITSELLEGDYRDRRLAYFGEMNDLLQKEKELLRIMKALVKRAGGK